MVSSPVPRFSNDDKHLNVGTCTTKLDIGHGYSAMTFKSHTLVGYSYVLIHDTK